MEHVQCDKRPDMNASNTAMSEFSLSLKDPPSWGALIHWGVLAGSRDSLVVASVLVITRRGCASY